MSKPTDVVCDFCLVKASSLNLTRNPFPEPFLHSRPANADAVLRLYGRGVTLNLHPRWVWYGLCLGVLTRHRQSFIVFSATQLVLANPSRLWLIMRRIALPTIVLILGILLAGCAEGDESALPNEPPKQPSNLLPAAEAADVSLTPLLISSPFSDSDTEDTHVASQWQVTTTSGDYSSAVFDSGPDTTNLTEVYNPYGILSPETTYYWRVRHQDSYGNWSSWSTETSFTTRTALSAAHTEYLWAQTAVLACLADAGVDTLRSYNNTTGWHGSPGVIQADGYDAADFLTDSFAITFNAHYKVEQDGQISGIGTGGHTWSGLYWDSDNLRWTDEPPEADETPPLISEVSASNITTTSATITWTTDEPATSQVEYGGVWLCIAITSLDESLVISHNVDLSGLQPNTTYHFRVKSKDASGNEAASEDCSFTTLALPDTTAPVISEVSVSGITTNSALITWSTDEPSTSQVEYGTTSAYGLSSPLDTSLVTSHSVSLSGLEPDTAYHFMLKSNDEVGNDALSADCIFITPMETISGLISSDATWHAGNAGSYRLIVSNTLIEEGVILTIEPGVTVKFNQGVYLKVDGSLRAEGLADSMITFTSAEANPDRGAWAGIWVSEKSTGENLLKYCIIEYASEGFGDPKCTILFSKGHIDNSIIRNNRGRGIIYGNHLTITNSLIEHNVSFVFSPVIGGTADSVVEGNVVQYNEVQDGGYNGTAGGIQGGGVIRNNIIRHNTVSAMLAAGGICSYMSGVGQSSAYLIEYNLIENNSVYSTGYGGESIAAGGILASDSVQIRYNTIRSNEARVSSGDLTAGSIAVSSGGSTQIEYNNFQDNSAKYEIVMGRFKVYQCEDVIATNNWWGTTDAEVIDQLIYDYYDYYDMGKVVYEPIAASPIDITDVTAPIIAEVAVSDITDSAATITWTTDEPATSQVEYGLTIGYGTITTLDESLVTTHSVGLSGLDADTIYHFRVKSKDVLDNERVSEDYTFTTTKPTQEVSGLISADTTWTSDFIYIVTGDVGVEQGVTLSIEPGTLVEFNEGCGLQVAGTLIAEGTSQQRITFASNDGYWGGIKLLSGWEQASSTIAYTIIENVRDDYMDYRHGAIQIEARYISSVSHNIIRDCESRGISVWHCGGFDISHNLIVNCSRTGIYSWCGPQSIAYNQVTGCEDGIRVTLGDEQEVFLEHNTLTNNGYGIHMGGSRSIPFNRVIHINNNIFDNVNYNAYCFTYYTPDIVDASNNWWGTTDESLIEQGIYDYYDDLTLAKVTYTPIATAPIPDAGPTLDTLTVQFIDVGQGDSILIDFFDIEVLIGGGECLACATGLVALGFGTVLRCWRKK